MAKAQPKNPRNTPEATEGTGNTPAAQEQGQDTTAQGTNNGDAAASAATEDEATGQAAALADDTAAPQGPVRDEQGRLEYEVVSPLNNGKRHGIGDRVWLSDEDAGPLLGHTVKPYTPEAAADEDEGAAHA